MCHWILDPEREREHASLPAQLPPRRSLFSQRPAWAAVLVAVLVAMVAVAALVFPSATTAVSGTKAASPATPVVESTPAGPDDAVPANLQASRDSGARTGSHCNHDL
jgi:hypothetical protein